MLFVFVTYSEVQTNTKRTKYVLTFTISYEQIQDQCDGQVARRNVYLYVENVLENTVHIHYVYQ